jgi:acyl carrier protein
VEAEEIRQAVLATIESVAPDADVQGIPSDRPLRQAIELDSMDWLNVIAGLHDRLCIEIPESDYERLETVDAMVDYVAARQAHAMGEATLTKPETTLPLPRTQHLVRGTRVTVRPMSAEDMEREADFVRRLSAEARYNRFMVTVSELPQGKLNYLTDVDQQRHVALVATVDHAGQDVPVESTTPGKPAGSEAF